MFIIIFLLITLLLDRACPSRAIGAWVLKVLKKPIKLTAGIRKKINISSLGSKYEIENRKLIESSITLLIFAVALMMSWFFHIGFREIYFISFLSVLIVSKPYLTMNRLYKDNCKMIDSKLPQILSQMILLIGAGMTTVKAMEKVTEEESDLLTQQLYKVTQEVKLGGSFERRLMIFMTQCQHIYITRFGRILLSHEKNGTHASKKLLQELLEDLWKNRRSNALKKGEEASTKLLLPMSIALIGIIILITVPAVYEMFILT